MTNKDLPSVSDSALGKSILKAASSHMLNVKVDSGSWLADQVLSPLVVPKIEPFLQREMQIVAMESIYGYKCVFDGQFFFGKRGKP